MDNSREKLIRMIVLLNASALTVNSGAAIAPGLPGLFDYFGNSGDIMVKMILTIPGLSIAVFAPFVGWFADRVGRKILLLISICIFALAGSLGFFLDALPAFLASRALLGVGVAGVMTSVTALIGDYYQGEERDKVIGLQGAWIAFGGVFFLLLGGFLAEFGWRYPFLTYLVGLIFVLPVMKYITEPSRRKHIEPNGSLEGVTRHPIILISMLCVVAFLGQIAFMSLPLYLPFRLFELGVNSTSMNGLLLAIVTLFAGAISIFYKNVKHSVNYPLIMAIVYLLMGIGFVLLGVSSSILAVIFAMVVIGLGLGWQLPNFMAWIMKRTDPIYRGRVVASITMCLFLGQFISPVVTSPLTKAFGYAKMFLIESIFLGFLALFFFTLGAVRYIYKRSI